MGRAYRIVITKQHAKCRVPGRCQAHCSCSYRLVLIVFSARFRIHEPSARQVEWRRFGSSSLSLLDFHCGNVVALVPSSRAELSPGHSVPARSSSIVPARDSRSPDRKGPGRHKDERRGFINGKPVSYANIDLQTLHYH